VVARHTERPAPTWAGLTERAGPAKPGARRKHGGNIDAAGAIGTEPHFGLFPWLESELPLALRPHTCPLPHQRPACSRIRCAKRHSARLVRSWRPDSGYPCDSALSRLIGACPMHTSGIWPRRPAARVAGAHGSAGMAVAAIALAVALSACASPPAHGHQAGHRGPAHAALAPAASGRQPRPLRSRLDTTRTFRLGPGRATRTFTFHERAGVILLNQLTVRQGVRAFVVARIPHLAGAQVWSWASRDRPSASCRLHGVFAVSLRARNGARCRRRPGTSASSSSPARQGWSGSPTSSLRRQDAESSRNFSTFLTALR
jgi:hypothetical protein